jgi:type IV fimbrial biogenesis protein FimT
MDSHANAMISRRAGFTVIELMITVSIIAILAMVAAPSLRDMVLNARMTSMVNDLLTDLSVARAEAVKRGVRATVCTSSNGTACTSSDWRNGWIIVAEADTAGTFGAVDATDVILKISPKVSGADDNPPTLITSVGNPTNGTIKYVDFRPSGVTTPGGGGTIDFHLCDARKTGSVSAAEAANKGRRITITGGGRAHSIRCTCNAAGTVCNP